MAMNFALLLVANAYRHLRSSAAKNILIIQSDPVEAKAVAAALGQSRDGPFHVEWARSRAHGLEQLARRGQQRGKGSNGIAAVLLDLFLEDSQGMQTFDSLFNAVPQIPILILIESENEAMAADCVFPFAARCPQLRFRTLQSAQGE
jgi:DNA-binding NarL/FixJ family response regulator